MQTVAAYVLFPHHPAPSILATDILALTPVSGSHLSAFWWLPSFG